MDTLPATVTGSMTITQAQSWLRMSIPCPATQASNSALASVDDAQNKSWPTRHYVATNPMITNPLLKLLGRGSALLNLNIFWVKLCWGKNMPTNLPETSGLLLPPADHCTREYQAPSDDAALALSGVQEIQTLQDQSQYQHWQQGSLGATLNFKKKKTVGSSQTSKHPCSAENHSLRDDSLACQGSIIIQNYYSLLYTCSAMQICRRQDVYLL